MIMIAVKLSLQKYIFISALISIILSASYSLRISKNRNSVQSFTTIKKGALTRLWQGGGVERDEEFELMKREIENMMVEKTPAAVVAPTELSSFEKFGRKRSTKQGIAVGSVLAGVVLSSIQSGSQVSGIALLRAMERDSVPIQTAVCNGKPTVVEFFADWCVSCKEIAPSMRAIERKYKDRINFVALDGMKTSNALLVKRFRVDGIPHIAFLTPDAEVKTALVGAVPKSLLQEEVSALANGKDLPIEGYDAFEEESHYLLGEPSPKVCPTDNS